MELTMNPRRLFLALLIGVIASITAAPSLRAEDAAGTAKTRIEALIAHVRGLEGAKFVRNGSEYSAANAAEFLAKKWQAHEKDIHTPAEFIEQVATKSSTTGKPYVIRSKDGKETNCGPYLTEQLKKLEGAQKK